jgi:hypothetical protein
MTDRRHQGEGEDAHMILEEQLREMTDELVTEVMRTAVTLEEVFSAILPGIPDDAFPGKAKALGLFELALGSVEPATAAAGERDCRIAIALIGSIRERILADLRTAAESHRGRDSGP